MIHPRLQSVQQWTVSVEGRRATRRLVSFRREDVSFLFRNRYGSARARDCWSLHGIRLCTRTQLHRRRWITAPEDEKHILAGASPS